jgi:nitronate monooxygenase
MWPDRRLCDLLSIPNPILQAPMAGAGDWRLASEAAKGGALGAIGCALLDAAGVEAMVRAFRDAVAAPIHLNFFCHAPPSADVARDDLWRAKLARFGVDPGPAGAARTPIDRAMAEVVASLRVEVVSFHFGLPAPDVIDPIRNSGAKLLASATTVAEARALEAGGVDAIIAQGAEAGGHRGMFLSRDPSEQAGTFALVPQIADAVELPVIAAGGVADGRGIAAAFALGASGVSMGTAYVRCAESTITPLHRAALAAARDDATVITNVFTGRPARALANRATRELGPLATDAPPFPLPASMMAPLRAATEARGDDSFSPLWAGQAAAIAPAAAGAADFTAALIRDARERLARLAHI